MYDKLPRVRYITPQGFKEVSDITTSFRIWQRVVEEGAYPIDVSVPETDRPEVFSHRVYGDSNMHWILLGLNNITNPYYEWVLSSQAFDNYISEKYPGYALFLTDVAGVEGFTGSFRTNDIIYVTGNSLASEQPLIQSVDKSARVVSYDPTYCKLVIDFNEKTLWTPTVGELIAGGNTDRLGNTNYFVARIGKAIETPYAAHHFENSNGELLNPNIPASYHKRLLVDGDFGFTFGATTLGRYILEGFGDYTITNRDQEIKDNDEKRFITMVSMPYLTNINRDVENLLNG